MCSHPSHVLYETNVTPILQRKRKRSRESTFLRSESQPGQSWDLNAGSALKCSPLHYSASRLPPGGTQGYHSQGYKPYFHGTNWECSIDIYTLPCVKQIAGGKLLCSTELSSVLCDDRGGWDGGWVEIYKYIWLIRFVVEQKPT